LLPADLAILKDGRLRYSLLLAHDGGIIDDLMVTRRADHFYLVVNGATKQGDIAHLQTHLPPGVVLDHMKEQALLALQGPKAVDALARHAPGVEQLTFMTGGAFQIGGVSAWISRSGYTGEDGFEISVPANRVESVAALLAGEPEVKPIGLGARDSLRLEAGLPLHGHDIDTGTTPVEADLGFALSKRRRAEGSFPGAQRIGLELENGALRKRVGLFIAGTAHRHGLCPRRRRRAGHGAHDRAARQDLQGRSGADALPSPSLHPQGSLCMTVYYTREHEWIRLDGDTATVGITDFAQGQLGDIVFVEVPEAGRQVEKGGEAAVVESVKAASDVYAPVGGEVIEGNAALSDEPSLVNTDPEGEGWFFKLRLSDAAQVDGLMDADSYRAFCAEQ
jgi:glycine cleavage system H protein